MNKKVAELLLTVLECKQRVEKATAELAGLGECFESGTFWESIDIIKNCKVINNELYDAEGNRLATDGLVDNLYFCNQSTGYAADDYSGYVYIPVNDTGSYISLYYEC